ncbi:MAG: hypothetical protein AUG44_25880 [Actinobacteria bacterium 13_1_20CM_3_71_11]|nr:MAG: hypothetical protein AUG44_25880 [Actinobacteria bacterium 13_1_20CM_3_71_11]
MTVTAASASAAVPPSYRHDGSYTVPVSVTDSGAPAGASGYGVAVSGDGHAVAFLSPDPLLIGDQPDLGYGIFVHDLRTRTTTRVDLPNSGPPVAAGAPTADVSLDEHGTLAAFTTDADLLGDGQGERTRALVRDIRTHHTYRIDVSSRNVPANGDAAGARISLDGRYVTFSSVATNLVPGVGSGVGDVYIRDLRTGTTSLISAALGHAPADGRSTTPTISGDGRFVAFISAASNLVPGDGNGSSDLFLRDRLHGTTTMIGSSATYNSGGYSPSISADGRYVAYQDFGTIKIYDRKTGTSRQLTAAIGGDAGWQDLATPSIDAHGHYIAFEGRTSGPNGINGAAYRYDLRANRLESAMGPLGNPQYGGVRDLAISADGHAIAFSWDASMRLHHFGR